MPTAFAHGTVTRPRRPTPADERPQDLPTEAELSSMTLAVRVERLLRPQHAALRSAVAVLRAASSQLSLLDPTAPALRHVAAVIDDLAVSMNAAFDREERMLFPTMTGPRAPAHVARAVDDHHEGLATRLRCLRLLATEVRTVAGINHHTMVVFASMATVTRLCQRHHDLEQWVMMTPAPACDPPPAPRPSPRPVR